jgi:DNA processing protein
MGSGCAGGVDYLALGDPGYPRLLREISDPPAGLYRRGPYGFDRPGIAVVGSRRPTLYGLRVARALADDLARRGFCVISGLARGIDTAAHEGALAAGGPTVAVLGTGLDVVYPPENGDLHRRIGEAGAVLSEFPLGRPPDRRAFPRRNRIVSGLAVAVVVVESAPDGGAMITARMAGEQGRPLFAVPGRIDQPTSAGCHQLIRDGAALLTGAGDILEELSYLEGRLAPAAAAPAARGRRIPALPADEARVLACFRGGEILGADALVAPTGLAAGPIAAALLGLELKGLLVRQLDGRYEEAR